jgi:hypothetical protein
MTNSEVIDLVRVVIWPAVVIILAAFLRRQLAGRLGSP